MSKQAGASHRACAVPAWCQRAAGRRHRTCEAPAVRVTNHESRITAVPGHSGSLTFPMTGKQESSSTRRLRTDSALVYLIPEAKTAVKVRAVNCGHHKNQTNQSSDNCQRALERNSRPNHPQFAPRSSRRPPPHQPFFPKILQEPWKCVTLVLATAIRARGPAVTRHFATHEHRLPIFPMSPNHAERTAALPVQPCRIRPLAAIPPKPFSVRLRSSGIVWDRPRSYDRTAARRPPFPQNCRNIRPIPPAEPAKERVNSRQNTPAKASEKKASPRHLGVVVISNDRSTKVGIYSMPAFNSDSGSHESWRADRRASRSRQPCPTPESDELDFRQMSTSPKHHPPSTIHYPPSTIHHPPSTIHHPLSAIHCSYTADSLPKSGLPPYRPSVDPHLMQPVCSKVLQDIQISATLDPTNRKIQWQPLRNAAESTFTPVSPARQTHTTLTPPNRRLPPPPAISTDDAKLPPGPRKDRLGTRSAPSSDPETLLQSPQWYPQSKQCHQ